MDCETVDLTAVHEEAGLGGVLGPGVLDDALAPRASTDGAHACGAHAAVRAKDLCELAAVHVGRQVLHKHRTPAHLLLVLTLALAAVLPLTFFRHAVTTTTTSNRQPTNHPITLTMACQLITTTRRVFDVTSAQKGRFDWSNRSISHVFVFSFTVSIPFFFFSPFFSFFSFHKNKP